MMSQEQWISLETGYLTVFYEESADLFSIEANLRRRATYFSSDMPTEDSSPEEKIRYQMDALFRRSRDILNMYPPNLRVKIRIFKTRKELSDQYAEIFHENGGQASFYVNKFTTIYTCEEDLSDSVIAHEMAHAIIDHYFAVIPPENIGELLASYVDLHLAD